MKRCIACGAPLWETPLLTLDNMPASAQHMPDAEHVGADKGLTLDLCQCSGCGLVQFDCEPVDYYRDVIRAGGYSTTMAELRRSSTNISSKPIIWKESVLLKLAVARASFYRF